MYRKCKRNRHLHPTRPDLLRTLSWIKKTILGKPTRKPDSAANYLQVVFNFNHGRAVQYCRSVTWSFQQTMVTAITRGTVPRGTVYPIPNGLSLWPRTMFRQVTPSPALNALPAEHEDIHSSISSMSWSVWWKHIHQRIVVFRAYTP